MHNNNFHTNFSAFIALCYCINIHNSMDANALTTNSCMCFRNFDLYGQHTCDGIGVAMVYALLKFQSEHEPTGKSFVASHL